MHIQMRLIEKRLAAKPCWGAEVNRLVFPLNNLPSYNLISQSHLFSSERTSFQECVYCLINAWMDGKMHVKFHTSTTSNNNISTK